MWTSLIAVVGTLLGSVTAYLLQQRTARMDRAESRAYEARRDRVAAVTALTVALADHRRTMWAREDLRLTGAPDAEYREARAASHATRSALTAPLTTLVIVAPVLADAAHGAAAASYALRNAPDAEALNVLRLAAIEAADHLARVAAAAA
ncbi:protein kilB [Streptomyces sp. JV185]|uniref:protein kilB n=1 Tax=Streptomyces sp. JV185 TaxID=858638 RepID=UPI002E76581C|nr:protein kilB [Streptomyces sp. JV185]MEE1768439.1 protein kilB [Streptomyces sp. JV185]